MKPFLWDLVLPLLLVGPVSARSPAHVYLPQSYTSAGNSRFSSLSPSTARLILAQRLDIGDFHTVGTLDGWEGDSFNAFGARQQRLFEDKTESRPNAIVVISNVKDLEDVFAASPQKDFGPSFAIEDPPAPEANERLFRDLNAQKDYLNKQCKRSGTPFQIDLQDEEFKTLDSCKLLESCGLSIHFCLARELHHHHAGLVASTLQHLRQRAVSAGVDLTVLLTPPFGRSKSIFRRSSSPSWGSYALPPRSAQTEDSERPDPSDLRPNLNDHRPRPDPPVAPAQAPSQAPSSPPAGILPSCYDSMSACESSTHSCSGHGECVQKYSYAEGAGSNINITCFACSCKSDERRSQQGGTITTHWAGPACQKQDVSAQFWLLAGFSVVMVGIITWAIGLLYNMGAEELPSVIGAGVAGPRPK